MSKYLFRKTVVLLVILTFAFPYLTWAFEGGNYQVASQLSAQIQDPVKFCGFPKALGTIKQSFAGQGKTIICLENLHCNYEVQKNISNIIAYLAKNQHLKIVGVEGASAAVKLDALRDFPLLHIREQVADHFVKEGKLTGAEYYAATGADPIRLEGVETPEFYEQSLTAVKTFIQPEIQGYGFEVRDALQELKALIYNPALLRYDSVCQNYRDGNVDLLKYSAYLTTEAQKRRLDLSGCRNLLEYLDVKQTAFSLEMDPEKLYQELDLVDAGIRAKLYKTAEERLLDKKLHQLDIVDKMLNISATPTEIKEYQQFKSEFNAKSLLAYLHQNNVTEASLDAESLKQLEQALARAEKFYALADIRSQKFVDNFTRKMAEQKENLGLMINGGYHTAGVTTALKQRGISYVLVRPTLTRQDIVNPYFSLLQGKKLPIEKLLEKNQSLMELPLVGSTPEFERVVTVLQEALGLAQGQRGVVADYAAKHHLVGLEEYTLQATASLGIKHIPAGCTLGLAQVADTDHKVPMLVGPSALLARASSQIEAAGGSLTDFDGTSVALFADFSSLTQAAEIMQTAPRTSWQAKIGAWWQGTSQAQPETAPGLVLSVGYWVGMLKDPDRAMQWHQKYLKKEIWMLTILALAPLLAVWLFNYQKTFLILLTYAVGLLIFLVAHVIARMIVYRARNISYRGGVLKDIVGAVQVLGMYFVTSAILTLVITNHAQGVSKHVLSAIGYVVVMAGLIIARRTHNAHDAAALLQSHALPPATQDQERLKGLRLAAESLEPLIGVLYEEFYTGKKLGEERTQAEKQTFIQLQDQMPLGFEQGELAGFLNGKVNSNVFPDIKKIYGDVLDLLGNDEITSNNYLHKLASQRQAKAQVVTLYNLSLLQVLLLRESDAMPVAAIEQALEHLRQLSAANVDRLQDAEDPLLRQADTGNERISLKPKAPGTIENSKVDKHQYASGYLEAYPVLRCAQLGMLCEGQYYSDPRRFSKTMSQHVLALSEGYVEDVTEILAKTTKPKSDNLIHIQPAEKNKSQGGIMTFVKEAYVSRGKTAAERAQRAANYDTKVAYWLEFVVSLKQWYALTSGLILAAIIIYTTSDVSLAFKAFLGPVWLTFFGLHFKADSTGQSATTTNKIIAAMIALANISLIFMPGVSFPVMLLFGFVFHEVVNYLLNQIQTRAYKTLPARITAWARSYWRGITKAPWSSEESLDAIIGDPGYFLVNMRNFINLHVTQNGFLGKLQFFVYAVALGVVLIVLPLTLLTITVYAVMHGHPEAIAMLLAMTIAALTFPKAAGQAYRFGFNLSHAIFNLNPIQLQISEELAAVNRIHRSNFALGVFLLWAQAQKESFVSLDSKALLDLVRVRGQELDLDSAQVNKLLSSNWAAMDRKTVFTKIRRLVGSEVMTQMTGLLGTAGDNHLKRALVQAGEEITDDKSLADWSRENGDENFDALAALLSKWQIKAVGLKQYGRSNAYYEMENSTLWHWYESTNKKLGKPAITAAGNAPVVILKTKEIGFGKSHPGYLGAFVMGGMLFIDEELYRFLFDLQDKGEQDPLRALVQKAAAKLAGLSDTDAIKAMAADSGCADAWEFQVACGVPLSYEAAHEQMDVMLERLEKNSGEITGFDPKHHGAYQYGAVVDARNLEPDEEVYFIGDIHSLMRNFLMIMKWREKENGPSLISKLMANDNEEEAPGEKAPGEKPKIRLVQTGDLVHFEDPDLLAHMDASVATMQYLWTLGNLRPGSVFCHVGNHEVVAASSKGNIFQVLEFQKRLVELYGMEYLDKLHRFYQLSALETLGRHVLVTHAGPISVLTPEEVAKLDPTDTENPHVMEAVDSRFRNPVPFSLSYDTERTAEARRNHGLAPDADVVVSHYPEPKDRERSDKGRNDESGTWQPDPKDPHHHVIFSANNVVSIGRIKGPEGRLEIITLNPPARASRPSISEPTQELVQKATSEGEPAWDRLKDIGRTILSVNAVKGDSMQCFSLQVHAEICGMIAAAFSEEHAGLGLDNNKVKRLAHLYQIGHLPFGKYFESKLSEHLPQAGEYLLPAADAEQPATFNLAHAQKQVFAQMGLQLEPQELRDLEAMAANQPEQIQSREARLIYWADQCLSQVEDFVAATRLGNFSGRPLVGNFSFKHAFMREVFSDNSEEMLSFPVDSYALHVADAAGKWLDQIMDPAAVAVRPEFQARMSEYSTGFATEVHHEIAEAVDDVYAIQPTIKSALSKMRSEELSNSQAVAELLKMTEPEVAEKGGSSASDFAHFTWVEPLDLTLQGGRAKILEEPIVELLQKVPVISERIARAMYGVGAAALENWLAQKVLGAVAIIVLAWWLGPQHAITPDMALKLFWGIFVLGHVVSVRPSKSETWINLGISIVIALVAIHYGWVPWSKAGVLLHLVVNLPLVLAGFISAHRNRTKPQMTEASSEVETQVPLYEPRRNTKLDAEYNLRRHIRQEIPEEPLKTEEEAERYLEQTELVASLKDMSSQIGSRIQEMMRLIQRDQRELEQMYYPERYYPDDHKFLDELNACKNDDEKIRYLQSEMRVTATRNPHKAEEIGEAAFFMAMLGKKDEAWTAIKEVDRLLRERNQKDDLRRLYVWTILAGLDPNELGHPLEPYWSSAFSRSDRSYLLGVILYECDLLASQKKKSWRETTSEKYKEEIKKIRAHVGQTNTYYTDKIRRFLTEFPDTIMVEMEHSQRERYFAVNGPFRKEPRMASLTSRSNAQNIDRFLIPKISAELEAELTAAIPSFKVLERFGGETDKKSGRTGKGQQTMVGIVSGLFVFAIIHLANAATQATQYVTYRVANGDWLGVVAQRFNTTIEKLQALNSGAVPNIHLIRPGQELLIEIDDLNKIGAADVHAHGIFSNLVQKMPSEVIAGRQPVVPVQKLEVVHNTVQSVQHGVVEQTNTLWSTLMHQSTSFWLSVIFVGLTVAVIVWRFWLARNQNRTLEAAWKDLERETPAPVAGKTAVQQETKPVAEPRQLNRYQEVFSSPLARQQMLPALYFELQTTTDPQLLSETLIFYYAAVDNQRFGTRQEALAVLASLLAAAARNPVYAHSASGDMAGSLLGKIFMERIIRMEKLSTRFFDLREISACWQLAMASVSASQWAALRMGPQAVLNAAREIASQPQALALLKVMDLTGNRVSKIIKTYGLGQYAGTAWAELGQAVQGTPSFGALETLLAEYDAALQQNQFINLAQASAVLDQIMLAAYANPAWADAKETLEQMYSLRQAQLQAAEPEPQLSELQNACAELEHTQDVAKAAEILQSFYQSWKNKNVDNHTATMIELANLLAAAAANPVLSADKDTLQRAFQTQVLAPSKQDKVLTQAEAMASYLLAKATQSSQNLANLRTAPPDFLTQARSLAKEQGIDQKIRALKLNTNRILAGFENAQALAAQSSSWLELYQSIENAGDLAALSDLLTEYAEAAEYIAALRELGEEYTPSALQMQVVLANILTYALKNQRWSKKQGFSLEQVNTIIQNKVIRTSRSVATSDEIIEPGQSIFAKFKIEGAQIAVDAARLAANPNLATSDLETSQQAAVHEFLAAIPADAILHSDLQELRDTGVHPRAGLPQVQPANQVGGRRSYSGTQFRAVRLPVAEDAIKQPASIVFWFTLFATGDLKQARAAGEKHVWKEPVALAVTAIAAGMLAVMAHGTIVTGASTILLASVSLGVFSVPLLAVPLLVMAGLLALFFAAHRILLAAIRSRYPGVLPAQLSMSALSQIGIFTPYLALTFLASLAAATVLLPQMLLVAAGMLLVAVALAANHGRLDLNVFNELSIVMIKNGKPKGVHVSPTKKMKKALAELQRQRAAEERQRLGRVRGTQQPWGGRSVQFLRQFMPRLPGNPWLRAAALVAVCIMAGSAIITVADNASAYTLHLAMTHFKPTALPRAWGWGLGLLAVGMVASAAASGLWKKYKTRDMTANIYSKDGKLQEWQLDAVEFVQAVDAELIQEQNDLMQATVDIETIVMNNLASRHGYADFVFRGAAPPMQVIDPRSNEKVPVQYDDFRKAYLQGHIAEVDGELCFVTGDVGKKLKSDAERNWLVAAAAVIANEEGDGLTVYGHDRGHGSNLMDIIKAYMADVITIHEGKWWDVKSARAKLAASTQMQSGEATASQTHIVSETEPADDRQTLQSVQPEPVAGAVVRGRTPTKIGVAPEPNNAHIVHAPTERPEATESTTETTTEVVMPPLAVDAALVIADNTIVGRIKVYSSATASTMVSTEYKRVIESAMARGDIQVVVINGIPSLLAKGLNLTDLIARHRAASRHISPTEVVGENKHAGRDSISPTQYTKPAPLDEAGQDLIVYANMDLTSGKVKVQAPDGSTIYLDDAVVAMARERSLLEITSEGVKIAANLTLEGFHEMIAHANIPALRSETPKMKVRFKEKSAEELLKLAELEKNKENGNLVLIFNPSNLEAKPWMVSLEDFRRAAENQQLVALPDGHIMLRPDLEYSEVFTSGTASVPPRELKRLSLTPQEYAERKFEEALLLPGNRTPDGDVKVVRDFEPFVISEQDCRREFAAGTINVIDNCFRMQPAANPPSKRREITPSTAILVALAAAVPFIISILVIHFTGQPLPVRLDILRYVSLIPTAIMVLTALTGWMLRGFGWLISKLHGKPGPYALCAFALSAQQTSSTAFFEVEDGVLLINSNVALALTYLRVPVQNALLYGLSIIGHENSHLTGSDEPYAYGVMGVAPAMAGAVFASLAMLGLGVTSLWVVLPAALLGALVVTGLFGWAAVADREMTEAQKIPAGQLPTLGSILRNVAPGQPYAGQHLLADAMESQFRTLGLEFNLNNLRLRAGTSFGIRYEKAHAARVNIVEGLQADDVLLVQEVPWLVKGILQAAPAAGTLRRLWFDVLCRLAKPFVLNAWRRYAASIREQVARHPLDQQVLAAECGDPESQVQVVSASELANLGGKQSASSAYKNLAGEHNAVNAAEFARLLQAFGTSKTTVWQAVSGQLQELVQFQSFVPNCETAVQALLNTNVQGIADISVRQTVLAMQQSYHAAKKMSLEMNEPRVLAQAVDQLGRLILRSKENLRPVAIQELGGNEGKVHLLLDDATRASLQQAVAAMFTRVRRGTREHDYLLAMQRALRIEGGTRADNQLILNMLYTLSLQEGVTALALGENAEPNSFGGMVTNGQASVLDIVVNQVKMKMVVPVLHNVVAESMQAIEALGRKNAAGKVTVVEWHGVLSEKLKPVGNFHAHVGSHLEAAGLFANRLFSAEQAYYRYFDKKTALNLLLLERVLLRQVKCEARRMDEDKRLNRPATRQPGYDQALEAVNAAYRKETALFAGQVMGNSGEVQVYAPREMRRGTLLGWAWAWGKHSRGFIMIERLYRGFEQLRLRNFSTESAA